MNLEYAIHAYRTARGKRHGKGQPSRLRAFKLAWFGLVITGWKNQHGWRPRLCHRLLMVFLRLTFRFEEKL